LPYIDRPRVTLDATSVRAKYPSLLSKAETYVHEDGRENRLLVLHGTLPMHYQGSVYNIPVEIFVPEKYPLEPPLAYVRPTSTMDLKPRHPHMSIEGRVYLPYLSQWQGLSHNLVTLCDEMARIFGLDPPVFARVTGGGSTASRTSPGLHGRENSSPLNPRPPPTYRDVVDEAGGVGGGLAAGGTGGDTEQLEKRLTEKLQENLKHFYHDIGLEIDSEYAKQKMLHANNKRIATTLATLTKQKEELVTQIEVAQDSVSRLDLWLANQASQEDHDAATAAAAATGGAAGSLDVDKTITAADPCSEKLMDLVSENTAIEDALFTLDRALSHDTIDVATFLREVRKLTRKQFLCIAHTKKIVEVQTTDAHPDRQHLHP